MQTNTPIVIDNCTFTPIHGSTAYELTRYSGKHPRLKIPPLLDGKYQVLRIAPYAFDGCTALTDIIIMDGIQEIGDYAFRNCTSLQYVKMPANSRTGNGLFIGCNPNLRVELSGGPDRQTTTNPANMTSWQKLTQSINEMTGGTGPVDVNLRELFSGVLTKRTKDDLEQIMMAGFSKTTPALKDLDSGIPKPWFFFRVFIVLLIAFGIMSVTLLSYENTIMIPGVILLGSFLVPITLLFFFYEINTPRNINIFTIAVLFLIGGCASLLITLWLWDVVATSGGIFHDLLNGIIEETAKGAIVVGFLLVTAASRQKNFILNGLLIGAAVGVGFSAFESAGYAFIYLLGSNLSLDTMFDVIVTRGMLAPGGHVIWAAITGAALMIAAKNQPFHLENLTDSKFLSLFLFVIILHTLWNGLGSGILHIGLMIIGLIVVFVLIFSGFEQVKRMKRDTNQRD